MSEPETDQPAIGYEEARDELVEVVKRLETGGVSLQDSIALWERGEELAAICQRWLDGARQRLDAATAAKTTDEDPAATDKPGGSDIGNDDDPGQAADDS